MDYKLSWNASEYGGVESIRLPSNLVWTPDVLLYNRYITYRHIREHFFSVQTTQYFDLLVAGLMGQYCFALWRPSASVVCCLSLYVTLSLPAGGRAADTARRASHVTSC